MSTTTPRPLVDGFPQAIGSCTDADDGAKPRRSPAMIEAVGIVITLACFAFAFGLVYALERI